MHDEREVSCLNSYEGVFDDPKQFILTPFHIPARSNDKSSRKYIEMSLNQSFVKGCHASLLGRLYHMHDELSLHNMMSIAKRSSRGKQIERVDLQLAQSNYEDGESVFHIFCK